MARSKIAVVLLILALCASEFALLACSSGPRRQARGAAANQRVTRESPAILRNTIGAQGTIRGLDPILVSGYGLVVGLSGTGSSDVPGPIRAIMEREMTKLGVGREMGPLRDVTPNEMLNDRNTAVVIVSASIPPGSPAGTKFDVQVNSLIGTATESLEDGKLYTTDLFRGQVRPAAPSTQPIGEASGEIFINPFTVPGDSAGLITKTIGRVLDGGTVIEPTIVTLDLDTPSHSRARAIAEAINARFPRDRGDQEVAFGRSEETIEINIPTRFRDDPDEFIQLLRHLRIDQSFPEQAAVRYARALRDFPELATDLSWCFQALGDVSIPHLRPLYDFPEQTVRLAAIQAGAKLGDMATRPHLEELIMITESGSRPGLVKLLGGLGQNPRINMFLRDMLSDPEPNIRVVAYEALEKRGDPSVRRFRVSDKYTIITVPSSEPTIYVTLQRDPRIVVFGSALSVRTPVFVAAWEDRLMLRAEEDARMVAVMYRDHRTERIRQAEVETDLVELIEFLGHRTTPEEPAPGLDLTYSQVIGAISQIVDEGGVSAMFVTETDRLALDLIRGRQNDVVQERPELSADGALDSPEDLLTPEVPVAGGEGDTMLGGQSGIDASAPEERTRRSYVVPLQPQQPARPDDADDGGGSR